MSTGLPSARLPRNTWRLHRASYNQSCSQSVCRTDCRVREADSGLVSLRDEIFRKSGRCHRYPRERVRPEEQGGGVQAAGLALRASFCLEDSSLQPAACGSGGSSRCSSRGPGGAAQPESGREARLHSLKSAQVVKPHQPGSSVAFVPEGF